MSWSFKTPGGSNTVLSTGLQVAIRLRDIPHHDTSKGTVLASDTVHNLLEPLDTDITGVGSGSTGRDAEIDLDVLVDGDGLCPVVPLLKVEVKGSIGLCTTVVVVILHKDHIDPC